MRASVRNFIKQTNLDTYECLCNIYDFVAKEDPHNQVRVRAFAREMRQTVDDRSYELHAQGERILSWLNRTYERRGDFGSASSYTPRSAGLSFLDCKPTPYSGLDRLGELEFAAPNNERLSGLDLFGATAPIPYTEFKNSLGRATNGRE